VLRPNRPQPSFKSSQSLPPSLSLSHTWQATQPISPDRHPGRVQPHIRPKQTPPRRVPGRVLRRARCCHSSEFRHKASAGKDSLPRRRSPCRRRSPRFGLWAVRTAGGGAEYDCRVRRAAGSVDAVWCVVSWGNDAGDGEQRSWDRDRWVSCNGFPVVADDAG
jgi:hypothetical protein